MLVMIIKTTKSAILIISILFSFCILSKFEFNFSLFRKNYEINNIYSQNNSSNYVPNVSIASLSTNHSKEKNKNIKLTAIDSGECGNNLKWTFDTDTGLLEITGSGPMENYQWYISSKQE